MLTQKDMLDILTVMQQAPKECTECVVHCQEGHISVPCNGNFNCEDRFDNGNIFYMVDLDMYREGYGVVETIDSDLFRSKSLKEAMEFARAYAKDKSHFDFGYLDKRACDYYEMTIRKYYTEDPDDGEYDDWDAIRVSRPRMSRKKNM